MDIMNYERNRTWAEVDLDALIHNVEEVRKIVGKKVDICGVVKADAYGHGVVAVTRALLEAGINYLAVSMVDEALQLRKFGFDVPILVLNHTDINRLNEMIEEDISQTIYSYQMAKAVSEEAVKLGKNVKVHLKIDTGMTRVGFMAGYSAVSEITEISKLSNLIIEGAFSHFAVADENQDDYTNMQFEKYVTVCSELQRVGISIPIKHVANSAATMRFKHMHLDMVRPGIILYGLSPSSYCKELNLMNFKPVMQVKSRIVHIKNVPENVSISYGRTYVTAGERRIATIPIGYADGFMRNLSNRACVLVNGQRAKVVGNICMDQCMIDITDISGEINVGDEVVIIGKQGDEEIAVEELAKIAGSINYEIVCSVGKRIPRFYKRGGEFVQVLNYLL